MTFVDMPPAVETLSPRWWLHRLVGQLRAAQPRMILMERYYRGDHPLPYVPRELQSEFERMLARSRTNFMRTVVEVSVERLKLLGFRSGDADADTDDTAQRIAEASNLEADLPLAFETALTKGRCYLSTWGERIFIEDPLQCVVEHTPGDRRRRAAGLKVWTDEWTATIRADVYLPDAVHQFVSDAETIATSPDWPTADLPITYDVGWRPLIDLATPTQDIVDMGAWQRQWAELDRITNPFGEVPIVPLINRPSLTKDPDGESELDDVYLTQDRINEMLFNRSLAAWTTAYRQKWATGIDVPVDSDGKPVEPFKSAVDRLWVAEEPNARFGSFEATDLKPYIESIEQDVQHIAVQTRTPRHYFLQQGQSPSGDAMKSAEAGLVAKVLRKQLDFAGPLLDAMRLAALDGPAPASVIWGDPEFRTLGELTDAVIKQVQSELIPRRIGLERLGYTPTEIDRIEALQAGESLVREARGLTEPPNVPAA